MDSSPKHRLIAAGVFLLGIGGLLLFVLSMQPQGRVDLRDAPAVGDEEASERLQSHTGAAPELTGAPSSAASGTAAVAVSLAGHPRSALFGQLRDIARASKTLDFTKAHPGVFERFKAERKQHRGTLSDLLRDVLAQDGRDPEREKLIHLVLSAFEGSVPLGRIDGGAMSRSIRGAKLGSEAFHGRALLALGHSVREPTPIVAFIVKLLLAKPPPDAGMIAAIHTLAEENETLLPLVRSALFQRGRPVDPLRFAIATVLSNDRALGILAIAGGEPFAGDDVGMRDVLVLGLEDPHIYIRMLAAQSLHDRDLVVPATLWPVVSEGLTYKSPHVRRMALPLAQACAPTPDELLDVVERMWSLDTVAMKYGVRLSMLHRDQFPSGALEQRIRNLPLETRRGLTYSARYTDLPQSDPLPKGEAAQAKMRSGARFYATVLLSDRVASIRARAVETFGTDPDMRDLIEPLVDDPEPAVAKVAKQALARIDAEDREADDDE